MQELTNGSVISHYTVKGKLGEGGTGVVYHAIDIRLLRPVALKLLTPGQLDNEQSRRRFIQEAQAASSLNHPNIVTIYDIGEADGVDFIAMEFLSGSTLAAHIGTSPLPVSRAAHYAAQIADALAAAHQAGIVHRDIKPANVMITQRDDVRLLDFGLAKLEGPLPEEDSDKTKVAGPQTVAGMMMGTLAYMSPEQAQGEPVGPPTDVFSFGLMLYEMLSGAKPFQGTSQLARLAAMLKTEAVPISQKVPGISAQLDRLVAACLRKDPAQRPLMNDVLAQLREIDLQTQTGSVNRSQFQKLSTSDLDAELPTSPTKPRSRVGMIVGAVAVASIAGALAWFAPQWRKPPVEQQREHVLTRITFDSGFTGVPALSADGKLVAYASDRGKSGNLDIWVQQIETGAQPVHVTMDAADETEPSFSPDGSRIAFRSERENGGIYVVPSLGGQAKLIAKGGRRPRYSPDGKWIAYWQGRIGTGFIAGSAEVKIVSAEGGTPKTIQPEFDFAAYPVWTPDGSSLLLLGKNGAQIDWWISPLKDGPAVRTGVLEALRAKKMIPAPGNIVIVPETFLGDKVLFASQVGDGVNLWEIALPRAGEKSAGAFSKRTSGTSHEIQPATAGSTLAFSSATVTTGIWRAPLNARKGVVDGELVKISGGSYFSGYPSLSDDGKKMVFVSERSGIRTIWLRDMVSGKETQLTAGTVAETQPKISGNGNTIAYMEFGNRLTAITTGPDGNFGTPEHFCVKCGVPTDVSQDGKLMLLESNTSTVLAPLLMDRLQHKVYELGDFSQYKGSAYAPRFSNDGKWVAFHTTDGRPEVRQIFVIPLRPGYPKLDFKECIPITSGTSFDREAVWSTDDSMIYFLSERDGFRCIWAQKLDPVSKRPRGEPYGVLHFHRVYRSLSSVPGSVAGIGLTVQGNQLLFSLGEVTGNVWMQRDEAR